MPLHKVSGSKLFEWINKFYPFHTLIRDKVDVHTEINKPIPIGSYFKCYSVQINQC
jgi:hypothetical protein